MTLQEKTAPIIASMKLDLHELTLRQLDWDDMIPDQLRPIWLSNFEMMKELSNIRFRRTIVPEDAGMLTGAIYIDLSKAFDTISHSSIIEKLPDFGITGMPKQWIGSYLFGRCQQVSSNGRQSSRELLFCGVPQGSILGPAILQSMLTTLYFNIHTKILMRLKR